MKHINQYINEGLVGDIILKLLDAGISWIDKGIDAIAGNLSTSMTSAWNIIDKAASAYPDNQELRKIRSAGPKGFVKVVQREALNEKTFEKREEKIDAVLKTYSSMMPDFSEESEAYQKAHCELHYQNALLTALNANTKNDKTEKAKADRLVKELETKYPKVFAAVKKEQEDANARKALKKAKNGETANVSPTK